MAQRDDPARQHFQNVIEDQFFIASFFVVAGSSNLKRQNLKILGDASYSIYLIHYPALVAAIMMAIRFLRAMATCTFCYP